MKPSNLYQEIRVLAKNTYYNNAICLKKGNCEDSPCEK